MFGVLFAYCLFDVVVVLCLIMLFVLCWFEGVGLFVVCVVVVRLCCVVA